MPTIQEMLEAHKKTTSFSTLLEEDAQKEPTPSSGQSFLERNGFAKTQGESFLERHNKREQEKITLANALAEAKGIEQPTVLGGLKEAGIQTAKDIKTAVVNTPRSAMQLGSDVLSAVAHPIETVENLGGLAVGLVQKLIPGDQEQEAKADALGEFFKERYGGAENLRQTFKEDPVGFMGDVALFVTGVGAVAKGGATASKIAGATKVSNAMSKTGTALMKTGEVIDPLGVVTKAIPDEASKIKAKALNKYEKASAKAGKITTEALQPKKADLKKAILDDRAFTRSVEKTIQIVDEPIKNFEDFRVKVRNAKTSTAKARNKILAENNFDVDGSYIDEIGEFIEQQKAGGQPEPGLKQLEEVLENEKAWINSQGGKIKRVDAQARKEFLQKKTKPLLKKRDAGTLTGEESGRMAGLDKIRDGLKKSVEGSDEIESMKVRELNDMYAGLLESEDLIAGQSALTKKASSMGSTEKFIAPLVNLFNQSGTTTAFFVARQAMKQNQSLAKTTKKVVKAGKTMKKAKKRISKAKRTAQENKALKSTIVRTGQSARVSEKTKKSNPKEEIQE